MSNIRSFQLVLNPISSVNGFWNVYQYKNFTQSDSFSFIEPNYFRWSNPSGDRLPIGSVIDLSTFLILGYPIDTQKQVKLDVTITINNGSFFKINTDYGWDTQVRNKTYFEVLSAPTYSGFGYGWSGDFCIRTPLQNQPPLQRISGSYTYSACSTPGSPYYPACSLSLTFSCGSYVREFTEIGGTQCLWPTTTSTTTLSGGGGGGSP
jgi:hypothetical protein